MDSIIIQLMNFRMYRLVLVFKKRQFDNHSIVDFEELLQLEI